MSPETEMLTEVIKGILQSKAIEKGFKFCSKHLKEKKKELEYDYSYYINAIGFSLEKTSSWSENLLPIFSKKDKTTNDTYVDLDTFLIPTAYRDTSTKPNQNLIETVFKETYNHLAIIGGPGSGKTTSMKKICRRLLLEESFLHNYSFPLVIRFREFNSEMTEWYDKKIFYKVSENESTFSYAYRKNLLFWLLCRELGIQSKLENNREKEEALTSGFIKNYVIMVLEELRPLLIFDGFDELSDSIQGEVVSELRELSFALKKTRLIVTSRYFDFAIDNMRKFYIAPLDDDKIKRFCVKWIGDKSEGEKCYKEIKKSPLYELSMKPLNLSLLTAIYEHNGNLPGKPLDMYGQIVNLLLHYWDAYRQIKRDTDYPHFEETKKRQFLVRLAYSLSREGTTFFHSTRLKIIYDELYQSFGLPKEDAFKVIEEIESHSGIFIQTGMNRYEFPHKTIQEYLAGEYLSRYQPIKEISQEVEIMPNELAVSVSFSESKNYLFGEVVDIYIDAENKSGLTRFLTRVFLEKVDFVVNYNLALKILEVWEAFFLNDIISKTVFFELLTNESIEKSFIALKRFYRLETGLYLQTGGPKKILSNDSSKVIEIIVKPLKNKKEFKKSYSLPIYFVRDWLY